MRKLLLLALLLYDIVAFATRPNAYDYEDNDRGKRHSTDERRNWRKKSLMKAEEHKDWEDRRLHDYDIPRYLDEQDRFGTERERDLDARYGRHFEDVEKLSMTLGGKSSETGYPAHTEKELEKKSLAMNCDRQHERYEACFAGCASVSCDNPRDRLRPCYPFCEPGCVCAAPYVRDDRTHKCVLPDDCSKGLKGIPDLGDGENFA